MKYFRFISLCIVALFTSVVHGQMMTLMIDDNSSSEVPVQNIMVDSDGTMSRFRRASVLHRQLEDGCKWENDTKTVSLAKSVVWIP
jgi:hypothetical protein